MLALALLSAPTPAEETSLRDCRLTVRARQALVQDDALATLNLGVSVRGGTAALWGKVPSATLARRAEDKLRKVSGIVEVRSELQVEAADDPVHEFLRHPGNPALEALLPPVRRSPAHLTSRWDDTDAGASVVPPSIVLMAPVQEAGAAPEKLSEAVEGLRQADARFQELRFDVRGGIVRLFGVVQRGGDAMEFAQTIAKVPGVERVVIGDVRTAIGPLPGRQ